MTLALIAGNGKLPFDIIQACQDKHLVIIGFEGQTDPSLSSHMVLFPLGSIGKILNYLHQQQVKDIIFGGSLRRPGWSELQLDKTGAIWLKKLGWQALKGDNDLLTGIIGLLQQEGFNILKPSEVLKDLLAAVGCLTKIQPNSQDRADIQRGVEILKALSSYDIGQAIVVQQGLVLGIEAIEGTKSLIQRCGDLKRAGQGGTLIKIAKTEQDQRIDLPTVGVNTLKQLKAVEIAGLAVSAGTTQILDISSFIELANRLGLFVIGLEINKPNK
jgi:DUF1009 family protein